MAKTRKQKELVISVILGVIAGILALTAVLMIVIPQIKNKNKYKEFKNEDAQIDPVDSDDGKLPENPIKFDELAEKNEDICAWLHFESLPVIDYPIVRPEGENKDTNYYLRRDLEGKYSVGGTVYIQKVNSPDFQDRCTVVYGHNMHDMTMFGHLKDFRNKEFFDNNPYFYVFRRKHILKYEIKSAFVYDDRLITSSFNFANDTEYQNFIDEVCNPKSLVKNVREDLKVTLDSKMVVLSTCTDYNKNERYLVVGVLVKDTKTE